MPRSSVWIVRIALIYLCVGATLGALLLVDKSFGIGSRLWLLRPLHEEFLLFGWMVQLVFGVAAWILPRAPVKQSHVPLLLACVMLNAAVLLTGCARIAGMASLIAAGRLVEVAAVSTFAVHMWPRVRSFDL